MTRRTLLALLGGSLAAAIPAVAAAVMLWTLVGGPLTATVNQSTTFTLTATNLDVLTELGCLEVDLPGSFVIESLGTPQASNGDPWVSGKFGNAVIVRSLSGGGRLEITESVQFTIKAHATAAGAFTWPNHAHRQQDCSTADQIGVPLAVTVLPAVLPTPTPTLSPTASPTPTATPTATPKPTPTATPKPLPTIIPVPTPTLPLPSVIRSLLPTPSPTPTPSETATATPGPSVLPSSNGTDASPRPGGGGTASPPQQTIAFSRLASDTGADAGVGLELTGILNADFVWFVPAASVGLPGLLVILWVALQAFGALAWIPAVRRMGDESGDRSRRP